MNINYKHHLRFLIWIIFLKKNAKTKILEYIVNNLEMIYLLYDFSPYQIERLIFLISNNFSLACKNIIYKFQYF